MSAANVHCPSKAEVRACFYYMNLRTILMHNLEGQVTAPVVDQNHLGCMLICCRIDRPETSPYIRFRIPRHNQDRYIRWPLSCGARWNIQIFRRLHSLCHKFWSGRYTPVPPKTATNVLIISSRSSHMLHFSMYWRSNETLSSNDMFERAVTCHSPVTPGVTSRRRRCSRS